MNYLFLVLDQIPNLDHSLSNLQFKHQTLIWFMAFYFNVLNQNCFNILKKYMNHYNLVCYIILLQFVNMTRLSHYLKRLAIKTTFNLNCNTIKYEDSHQTKLKYET